MLRPLLFSVIDITFIITGHLAQAVVSTTDIVAIGVISIKGLIVLRPLLFVYYFLVTLYQYTNITTLRIVR